MHLLLLKITLLYCENLFSVVPQSHFHKYQIKPFFAFHSACMGLYFAHCTLFCNYSGKEKST